MLTVEVGGPKVDDNTMLVVTVNVPALTVELADVTVTGPVLAAPGTVTVSFVADTTVAVADAPLNDTVAGAVKPEPFTVTFVWRGPDVGERDVTVTTAGVTTNGLGLLACALAAKAVTVPVVAPAATVAVMRVAETTLYGSRTECSCTRDTLLNPVPMMVIDLPTDVDAGDTEVIFIAVAVADAAGAAGLAIAADVPAVAKAATPTSVSAIVAEKCLRTGFTATPPTPGASKLHNPEPILKGSKKCATGTTTVPGDG
jgi:hypothetical protein